MSNHGAVEVTHIAIATEVFLDYDSKNREFNFTIPIGDTNTIAVVKPALADVFALLDVTTIHPLKTPSHSVTISDTAYRVITKAIADGFALDDSALIDKDYIGTKGNVATMSDILGLLYEHPAADSFGMSDVVVRAWGYVRNFSDTIALGDVEFNPLGTFILNTRGLNASNSQFELLKGNDQADALGPVSDAIALTPGKNLTDTFIFSDAHSYSLGKSLGDTIGLTEYLYIDFATFTDSLALADTLVNHFYDNTTIADNVATISDLINLSRVTGGVLNAAGVPLNNMTLN